MRYASCLLCFVAMMVLGCQQERKSDVQAEGPQGVFRPATGRKTRSGRVARPTRQLKELWTSTVERSAWESWA